MNAYRRRFIPPLERFMDRVEKIPEAGCWIWTGPVDTRSTHLPYGRLWFNGTTVIAHRFAWETFVGPVPDGLIVCHRCDVPFCVNPAHLFLGTPKDNTQDMIRKGRDMPARVAPRGKLTLEQVREIRSSSENQYVLASKYGVSQSAISLIKSRINWKHAR
jgi:hypothetical protein